MRNLISFNLVLLVFTAHTLKAETQEIELRYRISPNTDFISESTNESVNSLQVLEDRGIIANSKGKLTMEPKIQHLVTKNKIRIISGSLQADQTYPLEVSFLEKETYRKDQSGKDTLVQQPIDVNGMHVSGSINASGQILEESVKVSGMKELPPELDQLVQKIASSTLSQITNVETLKLSLGKSTPQEISLKVPIGNIVVIDVKMHIDNKLLAIDNGIARISQTYSMDFIVPNGLFKATTVGDGSGMMLYDTKAQIFQHSETETRMSIIFETAKEGKIEIKTNSKQIQSTHPFIEDKSY